LHYCRPELSDLATTSSCFSVDLCFWLGGGFAYPSVLAKFQLLRLTHAQPGDAKVLCTQSFAKDQDQFQGSLRRAIISFNSLDPKSCYFVAGKFITLAFLRCLQKDRSRSLQESGSDQRSPELWQGGGASRPSQPFKISLSPCCTKFDRHRVKSCSMESPSSAGMETCRVKAVMSRWMPP